MEKTIEQQVAQAILQDDIATIEIDGTTYNVAPPSIATLILISEIVSTLPIVDKDVRTAEQMVSSVLHHAKDFSKIGDIAATLILGARNITQTITRTETKSYCFGLVKVRKQRTVKADRRSELSKVILENVRPSVLWDLIVRRLNLLEIGDFFAITTSLSEANILRPTREVGASQTQSGQQS